MNELPKERPAPHAPLVCHALAREWRRPQDVSAAARPRGVRHTVLYLHLSRKHLQTVANPLDALTISGPDTARRTRLKHKP